MVSVINNVNRRSGRPPMRLIVLPPPEHVEDDSYTLDVGETLDGGIAASTSYVDIPLSTTTTAYLEVPESVGDAPALQIDEDSDGVIDVHIEAGVSVIEQSIFKEPGGVNRRGGGRRRVSDVFVPKESMEPSLFILFDKPGLPSLEESKEIAVASRSHTVSSSTRTSLQVASVFNVIETSGVDGWLNLLFSRIMSFFKNLLGWSW